MHKPHPYLFVILPHRPFSLFLALMLVLAMLLAACQPSGPSQVEPGKTEILETYGQMPLSFEANQGQTDDQVKFLSRGSGYSLFLTSSEAVLALRKPAVSEKQDQMDFESMIAETGDTQAVEQAVLRMQLVGANAAPQMLGLEELPGKVNYFIGNDPKQWRTNIRTYAKVRYQAVYPGVDLVYYGNQGQLEYDFVVAPGGDPAAITLGFAGVDELEVDTQGDLVLHIAGEQVRMHKPLVYQDVNGVRQEISGGYTLLPLGEDRGEGMPQVGFRVGTYDTGKSLVIDPVLAYSTYLGGSGDDVAQGITVDASGNAYVTGFTSSTNFPTANPLQSTPGGDRDVFVTKVNATGALVYSTYLGGSNGDVGNEIAVDAAGSAHVIGNATSPNFPTVSALQSTHGGGSDAFVAKLDPSGSSLVYATYLGRAGTEFGRGIALDATGSVYLAGGTSSTDFPTVNALQPTYGGGSLDVFVAKLDASGSTLVYSTYLGGDDRDGGTQIARDISGSAYVVGITFSSNFPTMNPAQPTYGGGSGDAFVAKLNPHGAVLLYSTYLGGSEPDFGEGIAVDGAGNAHVSGFTSSSNFTTTASALQPAFAGGRDAFVVKLDPTGSTLVYSTYLGGSGDDVGFEMVVDAVGNVSLTGRTGSPDFPIATAIQPTLAGGPFDSYVAKLNPTGSALVYSTYLGGSGNEESFGLALDSAGSLYVAGATDSPDFPTTNALQPAYSGGFKDVFIAKLALTPKEQIETLIDKVEALVTAGVLNQGQGNALIAKLEAAIQQLEQGNVNAAINQLQAFVNQVNGLANSGVLSPAEGQSLIDCANQVITVLGG